MQYPEPIAKLIDSYMKLPGIGQKTATRLAFYTIDMKDEVVNEFAKSLLSVNEIYTFAVSAETSQKKILAKYVETLHVIAALS